MSFDNASIPIEVFIVTNDDGSTNGFAEVSSVTQMLSPYARVTTTQLWNSTPSCYKIQNNGKNFVHAFVICKYLATIPESDSPSYKNLRQLVQDLTQTERESDHSPVNAEILKELEVKLEQLQSHSQDMLGNIGGLLNVVKSEIIGEIKDMLLVDITINGSVEIV